MDIDEFGTITLNPDETRKVRHAPRVVLETAEAEAFHDALVALL